MRGDCLDKLKMMVDMDDVICEGGFLYLLNDYLDTDYKREDFKNYYLQDVIPEKDRKDFLRFLLDRNMYNYCELLPNCYDSLKELQDYYDIYVGTSYLIPGIIEECGVQLLYKHNYLVKNLPFISPSKYIFLECKTSLDHEIKIDDKINHLENAKIKLLFTASHNENIPNNELANKGIERMNGWLDIKKRLLRK